MIRPRCLFSFLLLFLCAGGCVNRVITVKSDPPGALVYMNEQEIGRTPVSKEFLWYGNYDVVLRKEGYQTFKTQAGVMPPLWQIIPLDLITDMLPLTDEHVLEFNLKPAGMPDAQALLAQGEEMRAKLESSERTKERIVITTQPTTQPAK
jgi:hypothetical protein